MFAKRDVAVALMALVAWPVGYAAAQGDVKEKAPISIAQKDFDRVIKVKNGDLIEISVPMLLPYAWALQEDQPTVKQLEGFPKAVSVPSDPHAPVPPLGAGQFWINRYTVSTTGKAVIPLAWVYCRRGDLALTKDRLAKNVIPKPPDFRPEQKRTDLREGMVFKIKLDAQP
jgi:hypothetical protein